MPTAESHQAASKGEVLLAGCRIFDGCERWHCRTCKRRWGPFRYMVAEAEIASPDAADALMARVARGSASIIGLGDHRRPSAPPHPDGPLEEQLRAAFIVGLDAAGVPPTRVELEKKPLLPDWTIQPRGFDLLVSDTAGRSRIFAEMKIDDIDQTLWDLFKLTSLPHAVEGSYLIAVGPRRRDWTDLACGELFPPGGRWHIEKDARRLFAAHPKAWAKLLDGGGGRLGRCPREIRTHVIAREPLRHWPSRELRVARVEHRIGEPVEFGADGWPAGEEADGVAGRDAR
jgi:hypothetical protein